MVAGEGERFDKNLVNARVATYKRVRPRAGRSMNNPTLLFSAGVMRVAPQLREA